MVRKGIDVRNDLGVRARHTIIVAIASDRPPRVNTAVIVAPALHFEQVALLAEVVVVEVPCCSTL
jgi:hypothetical protein